MDIVFIVILVVLGFALLLLELLVLPGVGVAAIGGFALLGISIWQIFAHYGMPAGIWSVVIVSILSLIFIFYALRAKTWRKAALKSEIDGKADGQPDVPIHAGDKGKTVSRLAPAGKAYINGDYFEVRTFGEMLDPDADIEVIKIENRTIYVKPIKSN